MTCYGGLLRNWNQEGTRAAIAEFLIGYCDLDDLWAASSSEAKLKWIIEELGNYT